MFDHVTIRVSDREASERFYDAVLSVLGKRATRRMTFTERDDFSITRGEPVTRRLHVGFHTRTHELVDAFHRAATEAGYESDGAPGKRAVYHTGYYGAFVLDPTATTSRSSITIAEAALAPPRSPRR